MPEGTRFQVLAPVIRERKGEYVDLMTDLQSKGYSRVRIDGVVYPLTDPPKLKKQEKHSIEVVVDRLVIRATAKQRITDSVEIGLGLADGVVILDFVDLDEDDPLRERRYSERLACPNDHPLALDELEPRSFSFNSPFGACPECTGLGTRKEVDPELVVPDGAASLGGGAIHPWSAGTTSEYFTRLLQGLAEVMGFSMDTAWDMLPPHVRKAVLHGVDEQVHVTYRNRYNRQRSYYAEFEGVIPFLERRAAQTDSDFAREKYEGYMREVPCPVVPRHPAQARDPGRHHRARRARPAEHRRAVGDVDQGRGRVLPRPCAVRAGPDDRRTGAQGGRTRGSGSCWTSASTICR